MPVCFDFPGLGVDKEKAGTFRSYPYTGRRLLQDALDLLAAWNVSEFFECILRNGIAVQTVRRCAYIDLVVMPVQGGCNHFVHCRAEYVVYKTGCGDVEHSQSFERADKQPLRRKFHNAVDLQVLAVLFEEEVLELVFFLVIIRQAVAGADPYTPLAVGHNNAGDVVGDAVGVVFIVLIYGKCVSVVLVDAVVGGEPHIAELVLRYGEDRAL